MLRCRDALPNRCRKVLRGPDARPGVSAGLQERAVPNRPRRCLGPLTRRESASSRNVQSRTRTCGRNAARSCSPAIHYGVAKPHCRNLARLGRRARPRFGDPAQEAVDPESGNEGDFEARCEEAETTRAGSYVAGSSEPENSPAFLKLIAILERSGVVLRSRCGSQRLRQPSMTTMHEPPRSSASRSRTQNKRWFFLSAPLTRTT
jgi:hypothetical protein